MKIRMYDVKFGESFLMEEKKENLLVDFGCHPASKFCDSGAVTSPKETYIKRLKQVADDIASETKGKEIEEISVLLTHFHEDHINGFLNTQLADLIKVKTLYIPDVVAMNTKRGRISALQIEILKEILESVVLRKWPSVITLYELLKRIMDIKSTVRSVCFLERGSEFTFGGRKYDVLWPCFDTLKYHAKTVSKVIRVAAWLGLTEGTDLSEESEQVSFGIADEFIDELVNAYAVIGGKEGLPGDDLERRHGTLENLEKTYKAMVNRVSEASQRLTNKQIIEIKATLRTLKDKNSVSIVFQERDQEGFSRVLMTGDVVKSDLERVIENTATNYSHTKMSDRFHVVKAPHHGTPSHYIRSLPRSECVLLSNGENNRGYGKISYKYGGFYSSNRGSLMICTNAVCQLVELSQSGKGIVCENCTDNQCEKKRNNDLYLDIFVPD